MMFAATLISVLIVADANTRHWETGPVWLPHWRVCELMHTRAQRDLAWIDGAMAEHGWFNAPHMLITAREEATRVEQVWESLWWLAWPRVTEEQRERYTRQLVDAIGEEAYYGSRFPLPLSVR